MYGKADPEVPRAIQEVPDDDDDDGDDDGDVTDEDDNDDEQMELGKDSQTPLPSPPAPGPSSPPPRRRHKSAASTNYAKGTRSQQHARRTQKLQLTPPKSKLDSSAKSTKRRKRNLDKVNAGLIENQWVYGPKATANEVALWYRTAGW